MISKAIAIALLFATPQADGVELRTRVNTAGTFVAVKETIPAYVSTMTTAKWALYDKSETLEKYQKSEYLKNKYKAQ